MKLYLQGTCLVSTKKFYLIYPDSLLPDFGLKDFKVAFDRTSTQNNIRLELDFHFVIRNEKARKNLMQHINDEVFAILKLKNPSLQNLHVQKIYPYWFKRKVISNSFLFSIPINIQTFYLVKSFLSRFIVSRIVLYLFHHSLPLEFILAQKKGISLWIVLLFKKHFYEFLCLKKYLYLYKKSWQTYFFLLSCI